MELVRAIFHDLFVLLKGAAALVCGMGVLFFLLSAWLALGSIRILLSNRRARGTIKENVQVIDAEGKTLYSPRFVFTPPGKGEVLIQSDIGTSPAMYSSGEVVDVYYDPQNPARAKIRGFRELWFFPAIFAAAAVWCCFWGGLYYF